MAKRAPHRRSNPRAGESLTPMVERFDRTAFFPGGARPVTGPGAVTDPGADTRADPRIGASGTRPRGLADRKSSPPTGKPHSARRRRLSGHLRRTRGWQREGRSGKASGTRRTRCRDRAGPLPGGHDEASPRGNESARSRRRRNDQAGVHPATNQRRDARRVTRRTHCRVARRTTRCVTSSRPDGKNSRHHVPRLGTPCQDGGGHWGIQPLAAEGGRDDLGWGERRVEFRIDQGKTGRGIHVSDQRRTRTARPARTRVIRVRQVGDS